MQQVTRHGIVTVTPFDKIIYEGKTYEKENANIVKEFIELFLPLFLLSLIIFFQLNNNEKILFFFWENRGRLSINEE